LCDRYAALLRCVLRRILGGGVDIEDALQDVFLRLFRDLDTLREPSVLRSFAVGIAVHVAMTELRRRRARRWLTLSEDGALPDPSPLFDAQPFEERRALRALCRILDRVEMQRRIVFVLRYIERLELSELSVFLGCSLATAKRRAADAANRIWLLAARDPTLASYIERIDNSPSRAAARASSNCRRDLRLEVHENPRRPRSRSS
jgi:RNA polymerase sigma-70 factor (ECF subfamily)